MVKKEIRVIGIDDSPFDKFKEKEALVVGVMTRGGQFVEGILSCKVEIDGKDATRKFIELINKSKFRPQLQCIFLNGIAVAGFNVVDIHELSKKIKIPVVVVIRQNPDIEKIKSTLKSLGQNEKIKLIEKAGTATKIGGIYVQFAGIEIKRLEKMLKIVCTRSNIPEPLRLAHIIATGIVKGESKGKA